MWDRSPSQSEVRSAMDALRGLGVAKVEVHFSGGNDEGGADGLTALDRHGNKVDIPSTNAHLKQEWNSETRKYTDIGWVVSSWSQPEGHSERSATAEEIAFAKVNSVLEAPIYAEYGSFGGEFYVDGTLTWDVASGKHEMHGQYESRSWESF